MKTNINTAIWIDSDIAYILNHKEGEHDLIKIQSEIEHQVRYEGETNSGSRLGNQYINTERTKDERLKHQEHDYFKNIINHLPNPDKIVICGPSLAKKGLEKEINKIKSLESKISDVITVDSMTENQIIAFLKKCFPVKTN